MNSDIRSSGGDERLLRSLMDCPELASVLPESRQRRVLSLLLEESGSLSVRDIAVQLAARSADASPSAVPEPDVREIAADLHHRCLPKLETQGLIERLSTGRVAPGRRLTGEVDVTPPALAASAIPSWEALAELFGDPRRRCVASIVAERRRPVGLEELADELTSGERSVSTPGGDEDSEVPVALHHVDLPRLDDVGLIDYDSTDRTAAPDVPGGALRHWTEIARHVSDGADDGS